MKGKFIVVEGLEGAGKSSAIDAIKGCLSRHGVSAVTTTREPGGTTIAEQIRRWIKGEVACESIALQSEVLLMYAARVQLIETVIKPALERGEWVIGDRHNLSTLAYQGGGRGINEQVLLQIQEFSLQGFKPDWTLYLDIDPAVGLQRVVQRGEKDRIEQESLSFFQRVRESYLRWSDDDPSCHRVDASQNMTQVHQQIVASLDDFLHKVMA